MKIIVVLITISLLACNIYKEDDNILQSKVNRFKKIELPDTQKEPLDSKQVKIVTFINGDCHACVNELEIWERWFINDSNKVKFLFYYTSVDTVHFNTYINAHFDIGFSFIYDRESEYLSKNNIKNDDKMFQTFLLDKDNNVILVGNPLQNKKLAELYRREIDKRTKQ